jgi:hypothetical protein
MLLYIIVTVGFMYLSYRLGRVVGYIDASFHRVRNFVQLLVSTKQRIDDTLISHVTSSAPPQQVSLIINDPYVFMGNYTQLAERSQEIGELVERIQRLYPDEKT